MIKRMACFVFLHRRVSHFEEIVINTCFPSNKGLKITAENWNLTFRSTSNPSFGAVHTLTVIHLVAHFLTNFLLC